MISKTRIPGKGVTLEGVLHHPHAQTPSPGVVVCHPHPRYGGTMDSPVVVEICRTLAESGIAALRYNYCGVGGSEGQMAAGPPDLDDAREVLSWLALHDDVDTSRIGICGYSFGARVALETSLDERLVQAVASVACPLAGLNDPEVHRLPVPKLFIVGDHDHTVSLDQFRFLTLRFAEPREVHVVQGADHFFPGFEPEVAQAVAAFFSRWIASPGGSRRDIDPQKR